MDLPKIGLWFSIDPAKFRKEQKKPHSLLKMSRPKMQTSRLIFINSWNGNSVFFSRSIELTSFNYPLPKFTPMSNRYLFMPRGSWIFLVSDKIDLIMWHSGMHATKSNSIDSADRLFLSPFRSRTPFQLSPPHCRRWKISPPTKSARILKSIACEWIVYF